ncbi:alpha/beta hydrolase [Aeromicrobium sp. Marseille-Q0843]|uniref:Alpha/beta hydrolase n=1 Tax=Aeromicrobium phoceense TaxID=2754045 RepID=A0A838XQI8_9ACTN|nr:alpha/beta hydrolase [Aeromicrobium phoceense]MBA4609284.1 alpha/beta hydrolase [Aeromicrobium phoceense]
MAELDGIWWSSAGEGAAVVVPRLNVDWSSMDLSALTERFRVVIVAPRGFGPSARPGSYDMSGFVGDVERVLDHLGIESYATFGYSMNGVMAARLALSSARVTAVACGGFPLTADLSGMGDRARARNASARDDPDEWEEVLATYDPAAAEAFWDDVAALPPGALADLDRPLRLWWGEDDAVLASLLSPAQLGRDLDARGIPYEVVPGLDHDGMLQRLDLELCAITEWLSRRAERPRHDGDDYRRRDEV